MKVKYITFATSNWLKFKQRLANEFKNKEFHIFNENDIEDNYFQNFILKQKCVNRGFHSYIWKPYIIYQELLKLEKDVDILVYFDAGCDFGENGQYLMAIEKYCRNFYIENQYNIGCLAKRHHIPIRRCCSLQFIKKYNPDNYFLDEFTHYQATFVAIKNNDFCLDFINKWKLMMKDDYPQILEEPFRGLINNGGDQTYLQYLFYKNKIKPFCLDNFLPIKKIVCRIRG